MTVIDQHALPTRQTPSCRIEHAIPGGSDMLAALASSVDQLGTAVHTVWMPDRDHGASDRTNTTTPTAADTSAFASPANDPRLWVPDRMKGSLAPLVPLDRATRDRVSHPNFAGVSPINGLHTEEVWRRDGARVNQPFQAADGCPSCGTSAAPAFGNPPPDWQHAQPPAAAASVIAHQQSRSDLARRLAERNQLTGKRLETAYVLWALVGHFGGHHFYLNRLGTGMLYALVTIIGAVLYFNGLGVKFLVPVWLGLTLDLGLMPVYRARARYSMWGMS
jgi:hypothetical protein